MGSCANQTKQIKFNQMQVFKERGIQEYPGKNLSEKKREPTHLTHNKTPSLEMEPGPHWWEASALTTTPPLLFRMSFKSIHIPSIPSHTDL